MNTETLINIVTPVSGILVAWVGLLLTRRKNIEDKVTALQASAHEDRAWLRSEVNQLRKDNKDLNLEVMKLRKENRYLRGLCERHDIPIGEE